MSYQPKEFWENRLKNNFSLKGVGHVHLDEKYNKYLYALKTKALEKSMRENKIFIKNKSVLDIGCGTGVFTDYFVKRQAKKVVGIDITKTSVESLRRRFNHQNCTFKTADIGGRDVPVNGKFDVINVFDVLYHITDDCRFENAVDNIKYFLKKGGAVFITDIFSHEDILPAKDVHFRSLQKYQKILRTKGLEIVDISPMYYLMNRNFNLPAPALNMISFLLYHFDEFLQKTGTQNGKNMKLLVGEKVRA